MSLIRIIVCDKTTAFSGEIHGSEADKLVASLTAEPETIEELETAARRFRHSETEWTFSGSFTRTSVKSQEKLLSHIELEPFDAGIIVIDIFGRSILVDSTYSNPAPHGELQIRDRLSKDDEAYFPLYYELSEDWKVFNSIEFFNGEAKQRRLERSRLKPIETRSVLFGEEMIGHFVEAVSDCELPINSAQVRQIHADWLMTPRPDLGNKSPREVLLDKQHFINMDLQSRSIQHSFAKDEPPPLDHSCDAYKYAGFGTHEFVVYYDGIRELIKFLDSRFSEVETIDISHETVVAKRGFERWMKLPHQDYSNRTPSEIVEAERTRTNIVMSAAETIIDDDCPICIAMAEDFSTPGFWHLDAAHFDDEFAFSSFKTVEEWEEDKRQWEEFNREWEKNQTDRHESSSANIVDPDTFMRILRGEIPD